MTSLYQEILKTVQRSVHMYEVLLSFDEEINAFTNQIVSNNELEKG